jgi:hypothetical protein
MSKELEQELIKTIDTIKEQLGKSKDFVVEQLPDVIQQYLAWEFYSNVMLCSISLFISIVTFEIIRRFYKNFQKNELDDPYYVLLFIFTIMAFLSSVLISCSLLYNATKVYIAPKVVLVEKMIELTKGK